MWSKNKWLTASLTGGMIFMLLTALIISILLFAPISTQIDMVSALTDPNEVIERESPSAGIVKNYITIRYADKNGIFLAPGENFSVMVKTEQDAYLYCYYEDENGEIIRLLPNRFKSKAYLNSSESLILPGDLPFDMAASKQGVSERIGCFSSDVDILKNLPSKVVGIDFQALPVKSFDEVKETYLKMKQADISDSIFDIRVY
jgi:hypothetical protein